MEMLGMGSRIPGVTLGVNTTITLGDDAAARAAAAARIHCPAAGSG
jgi:hypothetical protein